MTLGRGLHADEIIRILDVLIGGTEPVGDEAVDEQREENLKTLIDVTNWCLEGGAMDRQSTLRPGRARV